MPRKSVKVLRTAEILDAFEICIARQGFNNVTLADVGQQAGIKRPAIRHFVGNRDTLRQALAQRYIDQAKIHVSALEQLWPPLKLNSKSAIASLLVEAIMTNENRFLALSNLFILAKSDLKINSLLSEWIAVYADCLGKLLRQSYKITKVKSNEVAYSIVMVCIGLAATSNVNQDYYSQLCSGAIAQLLSLPGKAH